MTSLSFYSYEHQHGGEADARVAGRFEFVEQRPAEGEVCLRCGGWMDGLHLSLVLFATPQATLFSGSWEKVVFVLFHPSLRAGGASGSLERV